MDAQKVYWQYLKDQSGCQDAEIINTGLIIDTKSPCIVCNPDALVNIPVAQEPLGIAEHKCNYSLAQSTPPQTVVEAAHNNKKFYCQLSSSGEIEVETGHDYYFQVQGTLSNTRKWCDFVVWTPSGIAIQRVTVDECLWERHKATLGCFYQNAILPELALPRHTISQATREPFLMLTEAGSSTMLTW